MAAMTSEKRCSRCDTTKSIENFNRNRRRYDGLDVYCRVCATELRRGYELTRKESPKEDDRQCSVDGCGGRHKGLGFCNRHLKRFRLYGDPLAGGKYVEKVKRRRPSGLSLEQAFKWHMPGEPPKAPGVPWFWKGPVDGDGYGIVPHGGRNHLAHRLSYERYVGPIPDGLIIRHRDDVPLNINPANLIPGTLIDNVRDRDERKRTHRGRRSEEGRLKAKRGAEHSNAKLTEADIPEIRAAAASGESQQSIADRYGVSQRSISGIVRRTTWFHVP